MRIEIEALLDYGMAAPADVLLQVEAAAVPGQRIVYESLVVTSAEPLRAVAGEEGVGQRCWAWAEGNFVARYEAVVEVTRTTAELSRLETPPPRDLPAAVVPYLLPSRYCQAELFEAVVRTEFAGLSGGALALAVRDWVHASLRYAAGSTSGVTTALHTFAERRGVCRDYAHLVVALCRAGKLPARCVSGYAPRVDPCDFHAAAEVWTGDGWHLLDATGMAEAPEMAVVAVGRDATDIAFMTVFGEASLNRQVVRVRAV